MRKWITLILLANVCAVAQHNRNSFSGAVSVPLSYTDAPTRAGFGANFGWHYKSIKKYGFGIDLFAQRVYGGNESVSSTKDYYFKSLTLATIPRADLTIPLFKREKLAIIPSIGAGAVAYSTTGGFKNADAAIIFFQNWGHDYFKPVFDDAGNMINAITEKRGVTLGIMPMIGISYELKYNLKIYARTGYLYMTTDDFDGYNVPANGNTDSDVLQVNEIGLSYLMYKMRFK